MRYEAPEDAHRRVFGRVVRGHGVASGDAKDPRFPDGTLALQWAAFEEAGLPVDGLFQGTVNVVTAPWTVHVTAPWWTVKDVRWHPDVPAETFHFVPIRASVGAARLVEGLVYRPDPETKPDHHQPADVLELLLPWVNGVHEGAVVRLDLPLSQVDIEGPTLEPEAGSELTEG